MGDDRLPTQFCHRDCPALGEWVRRVHQHDQLVLAERGALQTAFAWGKRQDPEVQCSIQYFLGDLPGGLPADLDLGLRVPLTKPCDDRQENIDGRFIGSDQYMSASQVLKLSHGALRLPRQPLEPFGVVQEDLPGFGQSSALRGAIEEPLVQAVFESPDRLAHGRLRAFRNARSMRP